MLHRTHSFLSPPERKTKETDIPFNKREKVGEKKLSHDTWKFRPEIEICQKREESQQTGNK